MTMILGAFASSMIRALWAIGVFLVLAVLSVLIAHAALAQEVISMTPTYQGSLATPTITLWRDGGILALIIVLIGVLIWRVSLIENWVRNTMRYQSLATALIEHELEKRGVQVRPTYPEPLPSVPLPPIDEHDPWVEEADKVAPPPTAKPVRKEPSPTTVTDMAHKFAARRRKGSVMQ